MTETVNNNKGLRAFLIRTLADPVLIYMAILVSSVMYHYRDSLAFAYGLAAYALGWVMFRLFEFMQKHKFIGFLAYVITAGLFLRCMGWANEKGAENYPISMMLWFITPQDSLQYNKWYTLAMFLFFFLFMVSVVYFFTRIQYRVFMNFLILIIPFAIYGKEYEEMPTGYIIAIAVGYIVLLTMFRQLSDGKNVVVVDKLESWKSGIIFTAVFAVIAAVIPKPEIEADRSVLETLINADAFTDRLVEMLNVFRDTATGDQFRGQTNDTPLYYARSSENLRLKTTTFSTYNYEKDSWNAGYSDINGMTMTAQPFEFSMTPEICSAVFYAAGLDSNFSENYGLSDYAGYEFIYPEKREVSIFSSHSDGTRFPVPQSAAELLESSYSNNIIVSDTGLIMSSESGGSFKFNDSVRYSYTPDGFFNTPENSAAVDVIAGVENYSEMTAEAYEILSSFPDDEKSRHYSSVIYSDIAYNPYSYTLLDYGSSEEIYSLAQEITAGLSSDYEKSKAIEWYFINNNYVYDLGYRKEVGENAEDFLFRTKTGVCYEYATAMTLLARAAGIPARYCEGFNMQTKYENSRSNDMYVITAQDAHGFPELYIKGYGWLSFEPTMTMIDGSTQQDERQAAGMLSRIGIIIMGICVLALLIAVIYPSLAHRFFTRINNRRDPEKAVAAVMRRICRLYGVPVSCTSHETAETVKNISGADILQTAVIFDRAEYGGAELTENDRLKAMEEYEAAYNALNQAKKEKRRQKYRKKL